MRSHTVVCAMLLLSLWVCFFRLLGVSGVWNAKRQKGSEGKKRTGDVSVSVCRVCVSEGYPREGSVSRVFLFTKRACMLQKNQ